jgi:hypothetical protein
VWRRSRQERPPSIGTGRAFPPECGCLSIAAYLEKIGGGDLRKGQIDDLLAEREKTVGRFGIRFRELKRGRLTASARP